MFCFFFFFFVSSDLLLKVDEFVKKERYGFLHFESGAAMKAMLAAGEHHTVGNFPPFIVRVSKAVAKNDNKYIPNQVFLHNLPRAANAANLKERFEQYGEIKDCRIMYHSVSGLPRTAKITFVNAAEFNNVIKKEQISFLGSIVDVRRSLVSTTGGGSGKGSGREYGDKRRKH